jgi:predicted transcriptional regulator of viral defense system
VLREPAKTVHDLALDQHGYLTAAQARGAGVDHRALAMMCRRGTLIREAFGLYRDPLISVTRWAPYMAAALWPQRTHGVLSHETALALYDLSDVNPAVIHLTIPKAYRVRRAPPSWYRLHHDDLQPNEVTRLEGLPVTTVIRSLRDCHRAHLGPALLRQAIAEARRTGHLSPADADQLSEELLATPTTGDVAGRAPTIPATHA